MKGIVDPSLKSFNTDSTCAGLIESAEAIWGTNSINDLFWDCESSATGLKKKIDQV
jgi:hypothetical protein